jgi:hypothetical protein
MWRELRIEAMANYWMIDGKHISDEEYQETLCREELARAQARQQAEALLKQLTDSYTALTEFMQQNPGIVQPVNSDAEHMQQAIYQKLRQKLQQNLQQADQAPRCCWIKEDGTGCGSPKMRTNDYCYAHMQMYEAMPKKLRLPAAEDANGIQMAIMEVQRALIDDEISEKKAGLLLYSLQIAAANLDRTTFGENPEEMVTECVYAEEERLPKGPRFTSKSLDADTANGSVFQTKPLPGDTEAQRKQASPRMNTDEADFALASKTFSPQRNTEENIPIHLEIRQVHADLG